jgi:hypothetical protein
MTAYRHDMFLDPMVRHEQPINQLINQSTKPVNSMDQGSFCKLHSCSDSQGILRTLCNRLLQYRIYKFPPIFPYPEPVQSSLRPSK